MNLTAAKQYIINRMVQELSPKLYYHGLHHTFDVVNAATSLAQVEGVEGKDLILLQTASYYHDAGFMEQYDHNEPFAVRIAEHVLPQFAYTANDIKIISAIIMTTNMQQAPQTLLEKIIRDADLDYLGRADFSVLSGLLRKEWDCFGKSYSDEEWNKLQVNFLEKHCYFTASAIRKNEAGKQLQLLRIKAL